MDFRNRFPLRLGRPNVDEEVDAELEFHLAMRRRELMATGMSEADARRAAIERFGNLRQARRQCRAIGHQREQRMRLAQYISEMRQDAVFALRQLLADRAFTIIAVATLALGIGATTAIFSTMNAVVLRPLAVPEPDRLVAIHEVWRDTARGNVSAGNFVDTAAEQTVFQAIAASSGVSMALARDVGAERVAGVRVTGGWFDVWGVTPALAEILNHSTENS